MTAKLTFHGLISPGFAIALGALAAAGVFYLYFREHGRFGVVRRIAMAILRTGVVGLALFLLLRPVMVAESRGERPRGAVLLIDNSLSMTQRDQRLSAADRLRVAIAENRVAPATPVAETSGIPSGTTDDPSRSMMVQAVLGNPRLKLVEGLEKVGPLRIYLFGQRLRTLEEAPGEPIVNRIVKQARSDETRTALADAITEVLKRDDGDPPAAIVVMTDGHDNASRALLDEAARECARLGIPLHIYGAGSSEVGNLELKDIAVADTLFFEDVVSVAVRWRARGFKQGAAEIVLSLGGQPVARREVPVREGEDFRDSLTFTPHKTGAGEERSQLSVSIRYKGAETFTEDNELRKPVTLVDRKVKILYVENSPRWEYKFLQPALLRDRRVEAKFLLANADKRALAGGGLYLPAFPPTRQEFFDYDVLILGDVPANYLGVERTGWIRDFVREGGSLIFIAGRQHAPAEFHASPLAEVLPVEFSPVRFGVIEAERPQSYVPVLTRAGERADMLALADTPEESQRAWQNLPGFYWHYPVTKLRPGAAALLVHPRQKAGDQPAPILATHYYGKGQVLFIGTDETWRWRTNAGDKTFGRFWGQLIYQMGLPHLIGTPKRVQLSLERSENVLGRPGYLYARVLDPEYRPYTGDKVIARLEHPDAKPGQERFRPLLLDPVSGQPGEYRALLPHDASGRFIARVEDPAIASLEYRVGLPPQHELEVAGMNVEALQATAALSGGKFYREEDLHTLAASIQPKKAPFLNRQEMLLWNPLALIVFIALILGEWLMRKFSNLS